MADVLQQRCQAGVTDSWLPAVRSSVRDFLCAIHVQMWARFDRVFFRNDAHGLNNHRRCTMF